MREVTEIADTSLTRRAPGTAAEARASGGTDALTPLADFPAAAWRALSERAAEPNGYYLPEWELAVNASAPGRGGARTLTAWRDTSRLIGLVPVVSMWRAYRIPLPALVSADAYGTLGTPLLDRDLAEDAAATIMQQARRAGAHALIFRSTALESAAMEAFTNVLRRDGMAPLVLQSHVRACLDASGEAEELLRDAMGAKKLKELRRQRNRLAAHGAVRFIAARSPAEISAALETFLVLEASGWKGQRGTALVQDDGDATFIRRATLALAQTGQCEIVMLLAGEMPVAAAVVLRHRERAFYFKLGVDERFAKFSPGVQLTLELTRHLCADPAIRTVDSTANPDHPMINPIWRGRLAIGDVLIPLRPNDPVVPMIRAALALRGAAREQARRLVHFVRKRQEKSA
jgi:CelD/BcsL family acetyltransferase involved in cellulose biosynthesis